MFNLDRAVHMLARIEVARMDNRWRQSRWGVTPAEMLGDLIVDPETNIAIGVGSCTSAFCGAGWVLHDEGIKMEWHPSNYGTDVHTFVAYYTEDHRLIPDEASRLLGIERPADWDDTDGGVGEDDRWNYEENAPKLFDYNNNIGDMYEYVLQYAADLDPAPNEEELERLVSREVTNLLSSKG